MLKGGVIMDVVNEEQARIAEEAGAVAGALPPPWDPCGCLARRAPTQPTVYKRGFMQPLRADDASARAQSWPSSVSQLTSARTVASLA